MSAHAVPFYNNPKIRGLIFQAIMLGIVLFIFYFAYQNAAEKYAAAGKNFSYDFLNATAGFQIPQALIPYDESMTFGRAILVGLLNTLLVAAIGIVLSTLLGFAMGIARLSNNYVVQKMAYWYIEIIRNLPLLFQLIFWYLMIITIFPPPRQSIAFLDYILLNQRGLSIAKPVFLEQFQYVFWALLFGLAASFFWARNVNKQQLLTGIRKPILIPSLVLIVIFPLLLYFALGQPATLEKPELRGFNVRGGIYVLPELFALLLGLVTYTAGFIAEIVRSGIQSVNWGQTEAGRSLGIKEGLVTRLIVIPQALRVIIPPLTSQFLNITKNSSLAVAIGYPDLVSVGQTVLNQAGRSIEIMALWMGVYLSISIVVSLFMNWYNARIALVER